MGRRDHAVPASHGRSRCYAAPQAHQIERGAVGNHGESRRARRDSIPTIRAGQRQNQPQMIAASQAEDADAAQEA